MQSSLNTSLYSTHPQTQAFINGINSRQISLSGYLRSTYHGRISGVFNYKLDENIIEFQVLNNSELAGFIKSTGFRSFKFSDRSIDIRFIEDSFLVLGKSISTKQWKENVSFSLETFPYTFNNLYNLSSNNKLISGIQVPAFIEYRFTYRV